MAQPKKAARGKGRSRRRVKKNIAYGIAHIKTSFNNTIVTITDTDGSVVCWESAGSAGFKGSRKSTPFAAQVTADSAARKGMEHGLERVEVHAKGAGSGRDTAIRSLQAAGLQVTTVKDVTPQAHNGCRPRKRRRRVGERWPETPHPSASSAAARGRSCSSRAQRCLTEKCGVERRSYPPGEHGRGRVRQSEYRQQLREKQKARRYYQLLEKQFRGYYQKASRQEGVTGENLLRLLERRLDNVLVRLGFAASRRQSRQLIGHGHWLVNGRRVDIPSYQVRPEDVITIRDNSAAADVVRSATELTAVVPPWLQADHDALTAKVLRLPERGEITTPVQEQLIVELYSK